jgi:dihydrofolate synthase/folylpolyglutamate synthase
MVKNVNDWYSFFFARENFESRRDLVYTNENFNLKKARELYALAGKPAARARFVHAAGTNGKGSVCFYIEQGLLSGYLQGKAARVGLFMSPHVVSACERIRIQGCPVSEDEMRWAAACLAERIPDETRATSFEMLFLAALLLFEKHACDWIILETGIGGRLDTTNIITPEVSVVTPVALDHTALLGTTLPAIAREKAGIIKAGVPVASARQEACVREVILARCRELGAPYHESAAEGARELGFEGTLLIRADGSTWQTKMPGAEQAANLDLALTALDILRQKPASKTRPPASPQDIGHAESRLAECADQAVLASCPAAQAHAGSAAPTEINIGSEIIENSAADAAALFKTRLLQNALPARLEYIPQTPPLLLDGAHNPQALRHLAAFIARRRAEGLVKRCVVITAMMADKDIAQNMRILAGIADTLILTALPLPRAASIDELEKHIPEGTRYERADTPREALLRAAQSEEEKSGLLILAAGSFVLAGCLYPSA